MQVKVILAIIWILEGAIGFQIPNENLNGKAIYGVFLQYACTPENFLLLLCFHTPSVIPKVLFHEKSHMHGMLVHQNFLLLLSVFIHYQ